MHLAPEPIAHADPQHEVAEPQAQPSLTIYLVKRLQLVLQALVDTALRPFEVTPLQYTILYVLRSTGPQTSASLARNAFLTPQTMHQVVINLCNRGFVSRNPNPRSKRSLLVWLTPEGEDVLARCTPVIVELESTLAASLSPGQQALFREILQTEIAAMGEQAARWNLHGARL